MDSSRGADMNQDIIKALESIRSNPDIPRFDEAATKQVVILRILGTLGWNPYVYDEVTPEYDVGGIKVDYALRIGGSNKVFIEAKRASESLESHQEQLLGYSFRHGVELAVLTNGLTWWMYLPLRTESWEQRRFHSIDILNDDIGATANRFAEYLSRSGVHSGSAVRSAGSRLDNLRRQSVVREALPTAWHSLIVEQDELLVDLIDEKVESLIGFKSGPEPIRRFLDSLSESLPSDIRHEPPIATSNPIGIQAQSPPMPANTRSIRSKARRASFSGRKITGFSFQGKTFPASTWKDLLQTLAETIYRRHPTDFNKVLELRGSRRAYYSLNPEDLREPRLIGNSGYYVETLHSADGMVRQCDTLLDLFGYQKQDLEIDHV